jgi:hypothetical protein
MHRAETALRDSIDHPLIGARATKMLITRNDRSDPIDFLEKPDISSTLAADGPGDGR